MRYSPCSLLYAATPQRCVTQLFTMAMADWKSAIFSYLVWQSWSPRPLLSHVPEAYPSVMCGNHSAPGTPYDCPKYIQWRYRRSGKPLGESYGKNYESLVTSKMRSAVTKKRKFSTYWQLDVHLDVFIGDALALVNSLSLLERRDRETDRRQTDKESHREKQKDHIR